MCSPYAEESGVRTFTGSRSASVDATFSDHADDCTDNGFPRPQGYVMNLTAIAAKEPPIHDFLQYVNFSGMAEGLVGMEHANPNLIFYFPILPQVISPDLTPSCAFLCCLTASCAFSHRFDPTAELLHLWRQPLLEHDRLASTRHEGGA